MKKDDNKENVKYITIIIIFLLCLGGIIWFYIHDSNQLKEESMYTKGVITETFAGAKVESLVRFEFYVNTIKYVSSVGYSIKHDVFDIGDSCFVEYAKTNPKNCHLVRITVGGNEVLKIQRLNPPKDDSIYYPPNLKYLNRKDSVNKKR